MKKIIIFAINLFICLIAFSQSNHKDIQAKLTDYLINLDNNFQLDSSKLYLLKFSCNRKRKINNLDVFLFEENKVKNVPSVKFNNLSFDSLYIIGRTKGNIKKREVILPYIIKKVTLVKSPAKEKHFTAVDFEKMFMLLQFIRLNKSKSEMLIPIIAFHEDSLY